MNRQTAIKYRRAIEQVAETLSDMEALQTPELFPRWKADVEYEAGARVYHDGALYSVLQSHTSQTGWAPSDASGLFAQVLIPDPEQIPDWVQPDSTNAYKTGDKVRHNGRVWESLIDNNVWEPGLPGTEALWTEVI